MKVELREFIDSQDPDLHDKLDQYYDLYLKFRANGNEDKASNDVLAFFQRNQQDLELNVDHEIDNIENNNFIVARGLKRKRSKRAKNSKKSKSRKSKRSRRTRRSKK
jgi:hypothetical protein